MCMCPPFPWAFLDDKTFLGNLWEDLTLGNQLPELFLAITLPQHVPLPKTAFQAAHLPLRYF